MIGWGSRNSGTEAYRSDFVGLANGWIKIMKQRWAGHPRVTQQWEADADWLQNLTYFSLNLVDYTVEQDNTQRAQTSAKTSNVNQKWSEIWIKISGLIRIRIQMSAGMLWIHYLVNAIHFAECSENRPMTMRNANKSPKNLIPQWWWKWKWSRIRILDRITANS